MAKVINRIEVTIIFNKTLGFDIKKAAKIAAFYIFGS